MTGSGEAQGSGRALAGKVAVITGAGSGVGRAAARLFVSEGAKVVAAELRDEWSAETVRLIEEDDGHPGAAVAAHCDVARETDVQAAIELACERFGRLDIMFNNAGIVGLGPGEKRTIDAITEDTFDLLVDVNFKGVFFGCKHAVAKFNAQGGGGAIVNTGSAAGLVAWGNTVYGATKGAIMALTRTLAIEQAPNDIRVNCTAPGGVDTNFARDETQVFVPRTEEETRALASYQPLGRVVSAVNVAEASLFLASEAAANITGVCLSVDGGHVAV